MNKMTPTIKSALKATVLSAALAPTLAACIPAGEGDGGGEGGELTAASFAILHADLETRVSCRAAFECPQNEPSLLGAFGRFEDQAACNSWDGANRFGKSSRTARFAAAGLTLHVERAQACLDALQARLDLPACSTLVEEDACEGLFAGSNLPGEPCGMDYHCREGFFCDDYDESSCGGSCQSSSVSEVERCGDEWCGLEEQCDENTDECIPKFGAGDSCSPYWVDDCTRDSNDVVCVKSDADGGDGYDGACVAPRTLGQGQYCDYDDTLCATGLECNGDMGTCEPRAAAPPLSLGSAGAMCDLGERPCDYGLACAGADVLLNGPGTCAPVKQSGQACAQALECSPELTCLTPSGDVAFGAPGTCQPPASAGAQCIFAFDCASGYCDDGVCGEDDVSRCDAR